MANRHDRLEENKPDLSLAEAVLYETLMDIACDHKSTDSERAFDALLAFRKVRHVEHSNADQLIA